MSKPYISNSIQVINASGDPFTATIFSVNCSISTTFTNSADGARFYISFYMDNQIIKGFTSDGTTTTFIIDEKYLIGQLGKTVST